MSAADVRVQNAQLHARLSALQQDRLELLHDLFGHEVTSAYLNVRRPLLMEFCEI
jgi:hypothetical protein